MEYLFYFLVALLVLFGFINGLAVLFRWLWHFFASPKTESSASVSWKECPCCGTSILPAKSQCSCCSFDFTGPAAAELTDLEATARQLNRFLDLRVIDVGSHRTLQHQVNNRRQHLTAADLSELARRSAPKRQRKPIPSPIPVAPPAIAIPGLETFQPKGPAKDSGPETPSIPSLVTHTTARIPSVPASEPATVPLQPAFTPSPVPRRSVTELLAAFMEQRNILWGELVGGLLIVGCSIALVISLWHKLEENPLYQFGIFVGVTAALEGAGLYTLKHWKLESTSRGLLVIANLLVPLNLLAITNSQFQAAYGPALIVAELAALALFSWLVSMAGRILVPEGRWLFAASLLAMSGSQLLVPRLLSSYEIHADWLPAVLAVFPVACHGLSFGLNLFRTGRRGQFSTGKSSALFYHLGISTFALAVVLGCLSFWSIRRGLTLEQCLEHLAPMIALSGIPLVVGGFHFRRNLLEQENTVAIPTAATAIGLLGMLVMAAAGWFAWPQPGIVSVVCGFSFVTLTFAAFHYCSPVAHGAALPSLIIGCFSLIQLLFGTLEAGHLGLDQFCTPDIGTGFVGLFVALALTAELLCRLNLISHANYYVSAGGIVALISLVGVSFPSRGLDAIADPARATMVYGFYGLSGLMLNLRWRRPIISSTALALVAAATLWALWGNYPNQLPTWGPVLAGEGLLMVILAIIHGRLFRSESHFLSPFRYCSSSVAVFAEPLARTGEGLAVAAILVTLWTGVSLQTWAFESFLTGACSFGLFFLLALVEQRTWFARLAGFLVIGTVVAGTGWAVTALDASGIASWISLGAATSSTLVAGIAVWTIWPKTALDRKGIPSLESQWPRWNLAIVKNAWLETGVLAELFTIGLIPLSLSSDPWALLAYAGVFLATTSLLLAWGCDAAFLCYVAAGIGFASILYALDLKTSLILPSPLLDIALLIHATFFIAGACLLEWRGRKLAGGVHSTRERVQRLIIEPFNFTGIFASVLALPCLLIFSHSSYWVVSGCLFWLAAIWLMVAWIRIKPSFFLGFQTVLTLAILFSSRTWLEAQEWFRTADETVRLWHPRSLQTFGIASGLLGLAWVVVRIVLPSRARVNNLLDKTRPGVDRLVLTMALLAQSVLVVLVILPDLMNEWLLPGIAEWISPWGPELRICAFGPGAWIWFALMFVVLIVNLWDSYAPQALLGLVFWVLTIPILVAGTLAEATSPAAVLCWGCAGCFLVISSLVWFRNQCSRLAIFVKCRIDPCSVSPRLVHGLLLGGGVLPVLLLTLSSTFFQWGREVPAYSSLLSYWDWNCARCVPLFVLSVALIGNSFRERLPAFAFAGGLLINLAVSLIIAQAHSNLTVYFWVHLTQANLISISLFTLFWLALRQTIYSSSALHFRDVPFLQFHVAAIILANLICLLIPVFALIQDPIQLLPAIIFEPGSFWGWLALLVGTVASGWLVWILWPDKIIHVLCGFTLAAGALAAISLGDANGYNWPAFHLLSAAWTLAGLAILLLGRTFLPFVNRRLIFVTSRRLKESVIPTLSGIQWWIRSFAVLVVLLAIRSAQCQDPFQPYGNATSVGVVCLTIGALVFWSRSTLDVYLSGILVNVIGSFFWVAWSNGTLSSFLPPQVICFSAASAIWLLMQLTLKQQASIWDSRQRQLAFSHVAATLAVTLLGILAGWAMLSSINGEPSWAADPLTWIAWGTTAFALFLALADPKAKHSLAGLYALGLIGIGLCLHNLNLAPRDWVRTAGLTLAPYVFLTAWIGWLGSQTSVLRTVIHLPGREKGWPQPWFLPVQSFIGLVVVSLSLWMGHGFAGIWVRLTGPLTLLWLVGAGVLMAEQISSFAGSLRYCTLVLAIAATIESGWAFLDRNEQNSSWLWLHRNVIVMVALALWTFLYGVVFSRWARLEAGWKQCCRHIGPILGALTSIMVFVILIHEALSDDLGLQVAPLAIGVVALAFVGLIAAGLVFAVAPGKDPLGLSDKQRPLYVYGAEIMVVLLFLHFRLTLPWLFRHGFFLQFWPFILMAIAFLGAALSEFCARLQIRVLAEPLERTGVFLPMLPVLSFWVLPEERYALLWLTAGLVYGFLFVTKRSVIFGIMAALAANMSLWVFLHHREIYFYQHPQAWLIPISLIALVTEYLNRDRLSSYQSAAIRHLALMSIYVSSTADMFIAGLGQSFVLHLVLALLAVFGVLAGMLLRVRAFLFLGVIFLVFDLMTIIWHAGIDQHQTWILWSSGIVLGVAILTLFGIFEKRRNDVLRMVEELKRWN